MKKKLWIVLLSIIICSPVLVSAKDNPFYKRFQTENTSQPFYFYNYLKAVELNNSYILLDEHLNQQEAKIETVIEKYNYSGNLISESKIEDYSLIDVANDDNFLYILCEKSESMELKKIDSNLNIIKSYIFTDDEVDEIYYNELYINSENIINVKNNKINILGNSSIIQLDLDLNSSQISENYNLFYNLFPKTAKAYDLDTEIYDRNDSYQVYLDYGQIIYTEMATYGGSGDNCNIVLLNKNDNELWRKKVNRYFEDYDIEINDIRIIDDYIVVIENYENYETDDYYSEIIVYNFAGDEIERIKQNNYYDRIIPLSLGFVTSNIIGPVSGEYPCPPPRPMENSLSEQSIMSSRLQNEKGNTFFRQDYQTIITTEQCTALNHEEFYYLYYLINSSVKGNGKVEVPNKSKAGQQVSLKTQADHNYTVKNVTVKDANGNVIKVDNGSFIMPEEDVIVEAEFVTLNNPYTKGGLVALIGIIVITTGSYLIIKRQKLND